MCVCFFFQTMPSRYEAPSEKIYLKPKLGLVSGIGLIVGTMIGIDLRCVSVHLFWTQLISYCALFCACMFLGVKFNLWSFYKFSCKRILVCNFMYPHCTASLRCSCNNGTRIDSYFRLWDIYFTNGCCRQFGQRRADDHHLGDWRSNCHAWCVLAA